MHSNRRIERHLFLVLILMVNTSIIADKEKIYQSEVLFGCLRSVIFSVIYLL